MEPADVEKMEQQATNLRDRLRVRLLARFGCRVSELRELRFGDIDPEHGTIMIRKGNRD